MHAGVLRPSSGWMDCALVPSRWNDNMLGYLSMVLSKLSLTGMWVAESPWWVRISTAHELEQTRMGMTRIHCKRVWLTILVLWFMGSWTSGCRPALTVKCLSCCGSQSNKIRNHFLRYLLQFLRPTTAQPRQITSNSSSSLVFFFPLGLSTSTMNLDYSPLLRWLGLFENHDGDCFLERIPVIPTCQGDSNTWQGVL